MRKFAKAAVKLLLLISIWIITPVVVLVGFGIWLGAMAELFLYGWGIGRAIVDQFVFNLESWIR